MIFFAIAMLPITAAALEPPRVITPTEGAVEIALADFDFIAAAIMENLPTRGAFERRFEEDMSELLADVRNFIAAGNPQSAWTAVFWGEDWLEPPTDDLTMAADYLGSLLIHVFALVFESFAHLGPIGPDEFERLLTLSLMIDNIIENDIDLLAELGLDEDTPFSIASAAATTGAFLDTFLTPASLQLYGVDLQAIDITNFEQLVASGMPAIEGNITTGEITDTIAYIHIASFLSDPVTDGEIVAEFFSEIQDFEHLIIDVRGNLGGIGTVILRNLIGGLITEPLEFSFTEFFTDGELARQTLTQSGYRHMMLATTHVEVLSAADYVAENGLTAFNMGDLEFIQYAVRWHMTIEPSPLAVPFDGEIWLLTDGMSASASELFALIAQITDFATVVGEPTAGVTGVTMLYVAMPHTGMVFRIDIASWADPLGRSLEEFGITPQIPNAEGLDAMETIMSILDPELFAARMAEMAENLENLENETEDTDMEIRDLIVDSVEMLSDLYTSYLERTPSAEISEIPNSFAEIPITEVDGVEYVPLRQTAYAHGWDIFWDEASRSATVANTAGSSWTVAVGQDGAFIREDRLFVRLDRAAEIFR